jgi:glycosyltransferase involved in cell wall biosynthesis
VENGATRRVLIVVENLPLPLDRRVWLECEALHHAGYAVSAICPKAPGDPDFHTIDGIDLYKYDPPPVAVGLPGYAREFAYCWVATARLTEQIWHLQGFDAIQACNPPDTYWALAKRYKSHGVKFVFDQHDLNPELYLSRFGRLDSAARRAQYRTLLWLEHMTYETADRVIATNESYAATARERGGVPPERITVVRSGPDTDEMRPVIPPPELVPDGCKLLVYLGIMGPQDGVDVMLHAVDILIHDMKRKDVHAALLGFGDSFDELVALADKLGLSDHVTFTGRAGHDVIGAYLSAAAIGVGPDPMSPLNDVSTMNKTMEYMAYALPVVTSDLKETRYSAGDAAVYVRPSDPRALAEGIARLLDDPEECARLGALARQRVVHELDWRVQSRKYVGVYDGLFGVQRDGEGPTWPEVDRRGRTPGARPPVWSDLPAVELRGGTALREFVLDKEDLERHRQEFVDDVEA